MTKPTCSNCDAYYLRNCVPFGWGWCGQHDEKVSGRGKICPLYEASGQDAWCLDCRYQLRGGANVGLCPKCGGAHWHRTTLLAKATPAERKEVADELASEFGLSPSAPPS